MSTSSPTPFDVTAELSRLAELPPARAIDVSQEMVLEIASGREQPAVIAARYGYEGMDWERLREWKPFVHAVEAQRAELERSGHNFRTKAQALTEDVFIQAYKIAKLNATPLLQKLDFIKLGAKLGGMEPLPQQAQSSGPGFYININLGDDKPTRKIEALPARITDET